MTTKPVAEMTDEEHQRILDYNADYRAKNRERINTEQRKYQRKLREMHTTYEGVIEDAKMQMAVKMVRDFVGQIEVSLNMDVREILAIVLDEPHRIGRPPSDEHLYDQTLNLQTEQMSTEDTREPSVPIE